MMTMTTTMRMCVHDDDGEDDEDGDDYTDVDTDDDIMHDIHCGVARGMCMVSILVQRA